VIPLLNTPARRITFAITLSVLIHAAIFWLPSIRLPHPKVQLPPLTARLEHLAQAAEKPETKPESTNPMGIAENGLSAASASKAVSAMKKMQASTTIQPFPKHVQLSFAAYQGKNSAKVGEMHHQLDVQQDRYTIHAETQTTTLTGLLNHQHFTQTSEGKLGKNGLQPEIFKEEKITSGGKQNLQAHFDWTNLQLYFSNGEKTALTVDAQDMLSFMYQLSQLPLHGEYFPLAISDGEQFVVYQIEIGAMEEINTPMGVLRARHLRQMHTQKAAYFEIWLAQEYRLLPVKFRQVDSAGELLEEFVISDIRANDK
jgi:hypothetical protein